MTAIDSTLSNAIARMRVDISHDSDSVFLAILREAVITNPMKLDTTG